MLRVVPGNASFRLGVRDRVYYYVTGYMYFLSTDESVPEATRASTNEYGLCKDAAGR